MTVYAARATCNQAQRVLENAGGRAGSVRVQVKCVPSTEKAGRFDLAQIGANARRATQDSTTVGYIGESDPHATRFSEPILEAAGIAQLPNDAMPKLLTAIAAAPDGGGLREFVYQQLK